MGLWLLLVVAPNQGGEAPYAPGRRIAAIEEGLRLLAAAEAPLTQTLRGVVDVADRSRCRSSLQRLRVACLEAAVARHCRRLPRDAGATCRALGDIMVVNKLSEGAFVSSGERYRLMRARRDYRTALHALLRRRYAALTTAMVLWPAERCGAEEHACWAAAVDGYCLAAAADRGLSWHQCAAAITWFMGSVMRDDSTSERDD